MGDQHAVCVRDYDCMSRVVVGVAITRCRFKSDTPNIYKAVSSRKESLLKISTMLKIVINSMFVLAGHSMKENGLTPNGLVPVNIARPKISGTKPTKTDRNIKRLAYDKSHP